jgi:hypothetical protein
MSPQAGWILTEEIVPRLQAVIPHSVKGVGSEDAEELIQDATAIAAQMLHRVELTGKAFTAGNIAYYAVQHLKSGRRSTGSSTVDVLAVGSQLNGRTRLSSLDEPATENDDGESLTFNEVLSQDWEDPAMLVARKLDWESLLSRLTAREKAIIDYLLAGRTVSEVAILFKVSRSAMQFCKLKLIQLIREFMGADILAEVRRLPLWKDGLNAISERQACRHARRG